MSDRATLCLGGAIVAALATTTSAIDLHVPSEYPTIQAAIDAAGAGDTVLVADGVYTGDGNRDLTFAGKAITVRSTGGAEVCIIDCDATQENPHRGFSFTSGETRDSVVSGFTIRNGSTPQGAILDHFNGAAILCANGSSPTIAECTFTGNWAGCWGGAVCCSSQSHPVIDRCLFTGNHSDDDGGAVFAWNGSNPVISNSVIVGNTSRVTGGGVTNFSGAMTIRNTTIAANSGPIGGGLYGWNVTMSNSIVWGNTGGAQIEGVPTVTYSNIQGGYEGTGNLDVDPDFVSGQGGDYHLAAGSPMIDAGDPDFVPAADAVDIDGDPRLVGLRVDIGPDERLLAGDVNRDGVVDFLDLLATLAAWGPCPPTGECPADVDDDGVVGFLDLLSVLASWGT
ncbi:MAG: hypothetical protein HKN62_07255 [Phycisphaerales bacterium]|nr:hypothetical protein [Phycisphaerales bacterium]